MDLQYSSEQLQLRDSVERYIRENYTFDERRKILSETGFSEAHWNIFASLGWLAIPFPEEHGGLGGTYVDFAILMEGFGRGLVVEPALPTVLAGEAISLAGTSEQKTAWLPPLIEGKTKLALACLETWSGGAFTNCKTSVTRTDTGWHLRGEKSVVIGGAKADAFIVSAVLEGEKEAERRLCIFLVPAGSLNLSIHKYDTYDGLAAADLYLEGVEVSPDAILGRDSDAAETLEKVFDAGNAAISAEAVGVMGVLCDMTLEYLKTRKQFGVTLGSNQALQHRMVDMIIALEEGRSAALSAALSMQEPDPLKRARAISLAKVELARTATKVGQEAVQLHGAIGVTDELPVGHFFKRLTATTMTFGDSNWHLNRIAKLDAASRKAPEVPR